MEIVASALLEFAQAQGINVDIEYCKKLAISGCEDSRFFTSLTNYQKTQYTDVFYPEKDPYGTNININSDTAKGHHCP